MSRWLRRRAGAGAAGLTLLAGCKNPLTSHSDDYGTPLPLGRLRTIQTLPIEDFARASDLEDEAAALLEKPPPDRLANLERIEVPLEQVRAWTLGNNLDIRVALIDPAIGERRVTEEEAAFEAVVFGSASRLDSSQPIASTLSSNQIESTDFEAGVRIPLRTGGEVTLSAPFSRTDTNNEFTFLNPSFDVDATISFTQPLLRNAGRRANTHLIRVASYQTGIDQARAKLEVIRQVAAADRTYWILSASWEALRVAKQQYALAQAQLEQSHRLFNAGRVAEIEVIRAEEGVANRVEDIIVAENDILDAQRELKRLMNLDQLDLTTRTMIVPGTSPAPTAYTLEGDRLVKLAIANRMELLELELQLAIDSSLIDLRENQTLPLLSFDYRYNLNGLGASYSEALNQVRTDQFNDWRVALSGEIPIGNDAAESRLDQALLERVQRLSTRESRVQTISQETLEAVDQIAARLAQVLVYGLDEGYFSEYRNQVRRVTVQETGAAARRHLRPAEAQVVVVGDAETVRAPLVDLGLGDVQILSM